MRSSWQRFARNAFQWSAHRPARTPDINHFLASRPKLYIPAPNPPRRTIATASLEAPEFSLATERASSETTGSVLEASLTPARKAFSAAAAIQLSVAQGNLVDAYLILNSIYYAKTQSTSPVWHSLTSLLPSNAFKPDPIPFSPQTPTGLVTHSLLHSLVQHGYRKEAADLTQSLVERGIKIHSKSLDAVFNVLTDSDAGDAMLPVRLPLLASQNLFKSTLDRSLLSHQGAARAFDLLQIARKSRQRRTDNMFRTLIALCIFNGEVIMASLIFGLMVKDWNTFVMEESLKQEECSELKTVAHRKVHALPTPYPRVHYMEDILASIDGILGRRERQSDIRHALQALANLSSLVENRIIPFHQISPLICTLSRGTASLGSVQVSRDTDPRDSAMPASQYFDQVLCHLIDTLPPSNAVHMDLRPPVVSNKGYLPALDRESYQELLRYALLRKRSLELANTVLDHMTNQRKRPHHGQATDALMSEVLAQAAVKLNSEELWDRALSFNLAGADARSDRTKTIVERYAALITSQPDHPHPEPLTTRINFLVSSGYPQLVKHGIGYILPGFRTGHDLSLAQAATNFEDSRLKDLRLAVRRGPKIVVSVLNALSKTGSTGTMSDVWRWAKEVEEYGWTLSTERGTPRPWALSIKAYTLMLVALGAEVKRGAMYALRQDGSIGLKDGKGKSQRAVGFGHRVRWMEGATGDDVAQMNVKLKQQSRHEAALARARAIYREAMHAHEHFYAKHLARGEESVHQHHCLPNPDALFFNAMLDIVGRDPQMIPRSPKSSPALARRYVKKGEDWLQQTGTPPRDLKADLVEVGKDILNAGYPIPPSLRPFFIGRGVDYTRNDIPAEQWSGRSLYRIIVGGKGSRAHLT